MKTYSNYMALREAVVSESSISTLTALDPANFESYPTTPKSDSEFAKAAKDCPGYKTFEKKLKALGCTAKHAYIVLDLFKDKVGGYSDLEISVPRDSKTNFWFRIDSRGALMGFKEDFLRMSMYAQIQPELHGKDLDDAVKEISKVRDFVQWFNSQDLATILPLFREKTGK